MFSKKHYQVIAKAIAEASVYNNVSSHIFANAMDEIFRADSNFYESVDFYSAIEKIEREMLEECKNDTGPEEDLDIKTHQSYAI